MSEVLGRAAWAFGIKGLFVDGEICESGFQDAFETGLKLGQVAWASLRKSRDGTGEMIMIDAEENLGGGWARQGWWRGGRVRTSHKATAKQSLAFQP